jgi:purine nucleosidase/pyrimidine-specific ribonucleoside hydrolase
MTRLVVDTDPGIDDALALLLAFGSPGCSVALVTTVAGNVELPVATANARRILAVAGAGAEPRIVAGAARPLRRDLVTATHYHGADGLGGLGHRRGPRRARLEGRAPGLTPRPRLERRGAPAEPAFENGGTRAGGRCSDARPGGAAGAELPCAAPIAIVEAARALGGTLILVAIGPLTNVALALERERDALGRIGRLVVMGGAVDVPGNVTPDAEFNMHVDPEAAARVLAAGLPVDVVPLDVTRRVVLRPDVLAAALATAPPPVARFVSGITRRAFQREIARGRPGIELHDPLAVGVALEPSFVRLEPTHLRMGPDGQTRRAAGSPNCRVALEVDADRFLLWFLARLWRR